LKYSFLFFIFVSLYQLSFSQSDIYKAITIDDNLVNQANSCIRKYSTHISIEAQDKMLITHKQIVTVFNKKGNKDIDVFLHYDKNINVKKIEAKVYDAFGKEIKKHKKRDFIDVNAVSGGTLYSDSRVYYLDYTPISYPYTLEFSYEIKNSNTAFVRPWRPVRNYYQSVENSELTIVNHTDDVIRHKNYNLDFYKEINIQKSGKTITCKGQNLEALKKESYSPSLSLFTPKVDFALSEFTLEGQKGKASNWDEMGQWQYDKLIKGRDKVSEQTKQEILNLTKGVEDPLEKVKIVYKYVQDNTRYISVQVGIGGWQPIEAKTVDEVKYGDCKGLTNYTKALLKIVGIDSKYTVVFAGSEKIDIDKDFASIQGNHVILNVPLDQQNLWLECTSQDIPFGFLGNFTDDRDVLVIDETGGRIKHTDVYKPEDNYQNISGQLKITADGHLNMNFNITSTGIQFDNKYLLEQKSKKEVIKYYKSKYSHLNNLNINSYKFIKNNDQVEFTEQLDFSSQNYCKKFGHRLMFLVNALNQSISVPDKIEERMTPFVIERGFFDKDNIEIIVPQGMTIKSKPNDINISSKYGNYTAEFLLKDKGVLVYKRSLLLKSGEFPKEEYQKFREFFKKINKADQSKVILTNKT
jgi:transglutaminase-like putative cysteine protease